MSHYADPQRPSGPGSDGSFSSPVEPGSVDELAEFARLEAKLPELFERLGASRSTPRTVVVIPSLSLDIDVLDRISGVVHYEERLLCLLMLLAMPRTQVIYVTSRALDPAVIDYYLHLIPGVPARHARSRLTLIDCDDGSIRPLTEKILARPRVLERIRGAVRYPEASHMTCFNSTPLERSLSVRLGVPLYATDPELMPLGTKSGSRRAFRDAGLHLPDGEEDLRDEDDVVTALADLIRRNTDARRMLIKLNEGFSGEGNASIDVASAPRDSGSTEWVKGRLESDVVFEAPGENWPSFSGKLSQMNGVAELFVDGQDPASPSVQCRIDPLGQVEIVSTHDQVLGGPTGQVFLGCAFPAAAGYRRHLHEAGLAVGELLRKQGVVGRYGIDFVSVEQQGERRNYAIEINLRKGGTTLPYIMLQALTGGGYDLDAGIHRTGLGEERYYYATDNLEKDSYRSLTSHDLVDIVVERGLHFDGTTQEGVVFHLMGAMAEYGKLGVVAVGRTPERARTTYLETVSVLDAESQRLCS